MTYLKLQHVNKQSKKAKITGSIQSFFLGPKGCPSQMLNIKAALKISLNPFLLKLWGHSCSLPKKDTIAAAFLFLSDMFQRSFLR